MTASLASLVVQETKAAIYARALAIGASLGLPTTSWQAGDPTRALYHMLAEVLETWEQRASAYVASGFLDFAAADSTLYDWLVLLAYEVYGYTASAETYATTTLTLTNGGGGYFDLAAGDVTVKNSSTGVTYHSTSGGILASGAGQTLTIDIVADTAGSSGSSGVGDIDTLVTTLLEVTCSNPVAAVGIDAESASSIVAGCRAKLGAMSPNGPADAYNSVVRDSTLTGTTAITRSRTIADSTTGDVTVYVAGPTGAVGAADVTAAQDAVEQWAAPLCITPTVTNCSSATIAVTYALALYSSVGKTSTEAQAEIEAALAAAFPTRPIGGDIIPPATTGKVYVSWILSTIRNVYPDHAFSVSVSSPAGDTSLALSEVATLGTVTGTITFVADP